MNERGGATWCHMGHETRKDDMVGPDSRSATECSPESSSLSAMPIIDISPLDLVVINSHRSGCSYRAHGATCSVTGVLVLLPIQV